jgi:hypothetical protein
VVVAVVVGEGDGGFVTEEHLPGAARQRRSGNSLRLVEIGLRVRVARNAVRSSDLPLIPLNVLLSDQTPQIRRERSSRQGNSEFPTLLHCVALRLDHEIGQRVCTESARPTHGLPNGNMCDGKEAMADLPTRMSLFWKL